MVLPIHMDEELLSEGATQQTMKDATTIRLQNTTINTTGDGAAGCRALTQQRPAALDLEATASLAAQGPSSAVAVPSTAALPHLHQAHAGPTTASPAASPRTPVQRSTGVSRQLPLQHDIVALHGFVHFPCGSPRVPDRECKTDPPKKGPRSALGDSDESSCCPPPTKLFAKSLEEPDVVAKNGDSGSDRSNERFENEEPCESVILSVSASSPSRCSDHSQESDVTIKHIMRDFDGYHSESPGSPGGSDVDTLESQIQPVLCALQQTPLGLWPMPLKPSAEAPLFHKLQNVATPSRGRAGPAPSAPEPPAPQTSMFGPGTPSSSTAQAPPQQHQYGSYTPPATPGCMGQGCSWIDSSEPTRYASRIGGMTCDTALECDSQHQHEVPSMLASAEAQRHGQSYQQTPSAKTVLNLSALTSTSPKDAAGADSSERSEWQKAMAPLVQVRLEMHVALAKQNGSGQTEATTGGITISISDELEKASRRGERRQTTPAGSSWSAQRQQQLAPLRPRSLTVDMEKEAIPSPLFP
eukprot:TRINITY_DN10050_c0_g1_i2.p1 TRINITY_DN10050_c0_g1~~TRINITY_DN10050_c0_g1_i2.p1  ORF type:complete len:568 (-),score=82.71 TRINITY_DN10050_c0_g1_i2:684-2264(-)